MGEHLVIKVPLFLGLSMNHQINMDIMNNVNELRDAPKVIRLAKVLLKALPMGEERDNLISIVQQLKYNLMDLDVFLQDLQLTLHYRQLLDDDETDE